MTIKKKTTKKRARSHSLLSYPHPRQKQSALSRTAPIFKQFDLRKFGNLARTRKRPGLLFFREFLCEDQLSATMGFCHRADTYLPSEKAFAKVLNTHQAFL